MKFYYKGLCLTLDGLDLKNEGNRNLVENLKMKFFIEFVLNKNGRYDRIMSTKDTVDFYFVGITNIHEAKICLRDALIEFEATAHFVRFSIL